MLQELTVVNFRNIENIRFQPHPQINFILGDNGAGKSSLLEAVDFLSRGRTFRTRLSRAIIREGSQQLSVSATLKLGLHLGARRKAATSTQKPQTENRVNGQIASSQAKMASLLPLVVFHAGHLNSGRSETGHWRSVLDWGVFHVKPAFQDAWVSYRRATRQRNNLLKKPSRSQELAPWNQKMIEQSEILDACRRNYAEKIIDQVQMTATRQNTPLSVEYIAGWPQKKGGFKQVLEEAESGDRHVGYTRYGPHRATLRLLWDGFPASERASQGQQKGIAALFMLVQVRLFVELSGRNCVVMIDDWAAEFDKHRREWLFEELMQIDQQVFVTDTEMPVLSANLDKKAKVFHMKHGCLLG